MSCQAVLEPDSVACVECGTRIGVSADGARPVSPLAQGSNTLNYREDRNNREFSANLSDIAINGLGEVLGGFFAHRAATQKVSSSNRQIARDPEYLDSRTLPANGTAAQQDADIVHDLPPVSPPTGQPNGEKDRIARILSIKGDSLELIDNRLKAINFSDFAKRLTYLALYAREIEGRTSTREAEVKQLLKSAKVWDRAGNVSKWLGKRIGITSDGEESIKLTAPGREEATKFLGETLDSNIEDKWNPDRYTPKPRGARKKKKA
ncbi:hypothetical protein [Edaphobacter bradus]|uniref:hypothetical protein n=1 Tax=Edaphobacter bradus TaxID=2259016 RepID=UPI0021DFCC21|nr:hypothetical protein [Edaphobacter bradus]